MPLFVLDDLVTVNVDLVVSPTFVSVAVVDGTVVEFAVIFGLVDHPVLVDSIPLSEDMDLVVSRVAVAVVDFSVVSGLDVVSMDDGISPVQPLPEVNSDEIGVEKR